MSSPIYTITQVGERQTDHRGRNRHYMWAMGIRMLCFALALATSGWLQFTLLAGSLILPWIAVVVANAGRENGFRSAPEPLQSPNELQA